MAGHKAPSSLCVYRLDRLLLLQSKRVHHHGLIDRTVGIIATDMCEDHDPAIRSLNTSRVVSRSWHFQRVPGLAGLTMSVAGSAVTFSLGMVTHPAASAFTSPWAGPNVQCTVAPGATRNFWSRRKLTSAVASAGMVNDRSG